MHTRRALACLFVLSPLGLFAGCGPETGTVSGEVLIDGQPLDSGIIVFRPADGDGSGDKALIQDGKYQLTTSPGAKSVLISAPVKVKAKDGYDITEERLPPRYHSETQLSFEVKPGSNKKDWSVESKQKKQ